MNKKRILLLTPALIAMICAGCSSGAGRKGTDITVESDRTETSGIIVGFSQVGQESDWRIANSQSMQETFTAAGGYYLLFEDAQQKQEKQIKALRNFILQEVDYIVLNPIVENGWDAVLQEAKEAGIPVIMADRMAKVKEDSYTCWVGSDFELEAENAGKWLEDYLKKQGREEEEITIVTLQGTPGSTAQLGRTKGFASVMKQHPNWKMLAKKSADFTQTRGREVMELFLRDFPDIDVLVSENDNMTFGAIEAIKEAGRTCGPEGDIIIISFDAVKSALEAMKRGEINADFECNPLQGPRLREIIEALEAGEEVDKNQFMDETYFDSSMDLEKIIETRSY